MRSLAPALLIAASVGAQTNTVTLTLASENGGANTRFSWSYTGSPGFYLESDSAQEARFPTGVYFNSGPSTLGDAPGEYLDGPGTTAFESPIGTITGLSTGLIATNTTTSVSREFGELVFRPASAGQTGPYSVIGFLFPGSLQSQSAALRLERGETAVFSGPGSSYLSNVAYSNFTPGTWTNTLAVGGVNYSTVLVVSGTPIPEPSTYGLILGALALAGAALRRRQRAK